MVYLPQFGSRPSTVVLKYAGQWLKTGRILRSERPDVVFVMTPPVFAALPAFWYARRTGASVVIDAHTAAFLLPRWRMFQWLQRALCRSAATTLVSNQHLADLVRATGGHATVVPDVPVIFERRANFQRPPEFTVAAVCSFDYDEPVEAIFDAAGQLPDVRFFVTGNAKRLSPALASRIPPNLTLTGFLTTESYGALLADADAALVLTTYDHTMLRGAYEAIYQGTPVIVSDWPLLRDAFPQGAIHVDNSRAAIVSAVREMNRDHARYTSGARLLRDAKLRRWESTRRAILARIGDPAAREETC
jgi:glycosyltransferase involved in cell wall biosynthesis